jgi:hypothetical protein
MHPDVGDPGSIGNGIARVHSSAHPKLFRLLHTSAELLGAFHFFPATSAWDNGWLLLVASNGRGIFLIQAFGFSMVFVSLSVVVLIYVCVLAGSRSICQEFLVSLYGRHKDTRS